MESMKKWKKRSFSTILWAVSAIFICAIPCGAYTGILTVPSLGTVNLGTDYAPDYVGVDNGWVDVYGAGAQRSDPKSGDPDSFPLYFGPQGDVRRLYNYVRCIKS